MSSIESIATPVRPTSPRQRGSSESRPSWVGRSKAIDRPVHAVGEQVLVALVGLLGRGVAGVLADRPRPLAVHLGVDAARERELAGLAEVEVLRAGRPRRRAVSTSMPESVNRRGSSGPTTGATERSAAVLVVDGHAACRVPYDPVVTSPRDLPPVDALAAEVDAPRAMARRGRAGGAGRAAGASCCAARRAEADLAARARAGPPTAERAAAAPGAQRDRRDRPHEPRPRAAAGRGARRRWRAPPRATRTSSSTWRRARAGRGTTTSRRCCASSPAPRRRSRSTTAPARSLLAAAALAGPGREVDRLARPARGDRRRVPRARGDRAGGRAAGRGRHHQPHAAAPTTRARSATPRARSCARTRRTSASSGSCRRSRSRSCASSACR